MQSLMSIKTIVLSFVAIFAAQVAFSQNADEKSLVPKGKKIYIPKELQEYDFNSKESPFSYHRMAYTDDIVIFWDKGFGDDPAKAPKLNGRDMTVDINHLLECTQHFYEFYRDTLKFLKENTLANEYRMMVMVKYEEDGTAYGGSYDDVIGALWVTPLRLKDVKHNCIAHELGHSFQAQVGNDGHRSPGGGIWEYTSQWMLWQVNPYWTTDENYHWVEWMKQTHKALFSFENMYRAPYVMEYWSNKHGINIITRIWQENEGREDVVQAYQRLTGITQQQFNDEIFDASLRFITYDLDRIRLTSRPYANKHTSTLTPLTYGWYMIDANRTPQNYGYNGIPLAVPAAGETVTLTLEGKMPAGWNYEVQPSKRLERSDSEATGEWKYALLPVVDDTIPMYDLALRATTVEGHGKTISFKVPKGENITHLWLVVSTAPDEHSLDTKIQWPYMVRLTGTQPIKP